MVSAKPKGGRMGQKDWDSGKSSSSVLMINAACPRSCFPQLLPASLTVRLPACLSV